VTDNECYSNIHMGERLGVRYIRTTSTQIFDHQTQYLNSFICEFGPERSAIAL